MKTYSKLLYTSMLMLSFAACNHAQEQHAQENLRMINPDLTNLIDRVGQKVTSLTTLTLNGGDTTKTLLSVSTALAAMQTILATNLSNAQNILDNDINTLNFNTQTLINNLGTTNDTSGLYETLASLLVSQKSATSLLLYSNSQADLQTGQVGLIQLSRRRPELTTTLTATTNPHSDVTFYNTIVGVTLGNLDSMVTAIQTNITTPSPDNLAAAQLATHVADANLNSTVQAANSLINDNITVTSAYSLEQIDDVLTLLRTRLTYLQSLGLKQIPS